MKRQEFNRLVGNNIRYIRKKIKLTQLEVADNMGVTTRTVGNWESGRNLSTFIIFALSQLFECSMDEFFLNINSTECVK